MRNVYVAMFAALACGGVAGATTLHGDDFLAGATQGWEGGTFPQGQTDGGPLGAGDGYLRVVTNFANLAVHNSLSAWTGDYTTLAAETISVDMRNEMGSAPLHMRLVLFGANAAPTAADRWTSSVAAIVSADGVWCNYSFSLAESDLTRVLGSDTYQNMITNVVRVMLRHDPDPPSAGGVVVSATLGIDNVRLAAAPLPGDYNRDGEVDLSDYHTWRGMFGATGSAADGNSNGIVDAAGYTVWRDRASLTPVAAHAMPEPAFKPLAGLALSGWLLVKRRSPGRAGGSCEAV